MSEEVEMLVPATAIPNGPISLTTLVTCSLELINNLVLRLFILNLFCYYYRLCVPKTACGHFFLGVLPAFLLFLITCFLSPFNDDDVAAAALLGHGIESQRQVFVLHDQKTLSPQDLCTPDL